nr:MAG TPA: hypothetical protein [Caudoviricetes sp.]DAM97249.1 MAG TPA: hypothetical protein [Caudoviricetes sp.]
MNAGSVFAFACPLVGEGNKPNQNFFGGEK